MFRPSSEGINILHDDDRNKRPKHTIVDELIVFQTLCLLWLYKQISI